MNVPIPQDTYRMGLMGGTFDPVHFGHLRTGEEIKDRFHLDVLEFIPALMSPHKRAYPVTDPKHRVEMLRRAIHGNESFRLSEVEIHRGGISYLYDTLHEYRTGLGSKAQFYFIMGMDSFLEIATWYRYADLFSLTHFVITTRPGYQRLVLAEVVSPEVARGFRAIETQGTMIEHESGNRIYFEEIPSLDISATDIRDRIASGGSVRYLLPDSVWRYIVDNHLYAQDEVAHRR